MEKLVKIGEGATSEAPSEDVKPIGRSGTDASPAPEERKGGNIRDFIAHMKRPVEQIEAPPMMTGADDAGTGGPGGPEPGGEPITDDDQGNMQYLDYSEEHRMTALFFIGAIDSGMGWAGTLISGLAPDRYQKFSDERKPPEYYVNVTAALVKKYQAKMSLEAMFFSALLMIYGPVMKVAYDDKKAEELRQQAAQKAAQNGQK